MRTELILITVTIWNVDIKENCPPSYNDSRVMFDTNNIFLTDNNYQLFRSAYCTTRSHPNWSGRTIDNWVTLKVYNMLGQEVLTFLDENKVAGRYDLRIDGTQLASSVYSYRLIEGDYVSTKKFVLLK